MNLKNNYKDNKKTEICHYWKKGKCNNGNDCSFAHGKEELRKKECVSFYTCWNEDCNFGHDENRKPYDNKIECLWCSKPEIICDKLNKKYKHKYVKLDKEDVLKNPNYEKNFKLDINDNEEFLPMNNILKNINKENKLFYSDIVKKEEEIKVDDTYEYSDESTLDLKNMLNIKDNKIMKEEIKIENYDKEQYLKNLEKRLNDWSLTDKEYEEIRNEIKESREEYNFNHNNIGDINKTEIKITINEYNNDDKIINLINDMENQIKTFSDEMEQIINNVIKDDYYKYTLFDNLDELKLRLYKFKLMVERQKHLN